MKRFAGVFLLAVSLVGVMFLPGLRSSADEDGVSPRVVARVHLTFRTADLPTTVTLYTPVETGLYRINGYAVATNIEPSSPVFASVFFSFAWNDGVSQKTQAGLPALLPPLSLLLGGYSSTNFVVRAAETTPITFSAVNFAVNPPNDEFGVLFTIEKL